MASVYKRTRWVDENGKRCTKDTPGARQVESRFYIIAYKGADGRMKRKQGCTDRKATEQLAAKLEMAAARSEEGMVDVYPLQLSRYQYASTHFLSYRLHNGSSRPLSLIRVAVYIQDDRYQPPRKYEQTKFHPCSVPAGSWLDGEMEVFGLPKDADRKNLQLKLVELRYRD